MKNVIIYPHVGSYHHGYEATIRTIISLLERYYLRGLTHKMLFSTNPEEDHKFKLCAQCHIVPQNTSIKSQSSFRQLSNKILSLFVDGDFDVKNKLLNKIRKKSLLLYIAYDNFYYTQSNISYEINNRALRKGAKTVLCGCSVEPDSVDQEMLQGLKKFNFILAKEKMTFELLLGYGLKNVKFCPDSSFLLEPKSVDLPFGFNNEKIVGINLSPTILSYEKKHGIVLQNYISLIEYIIEKTDYKIALIPHVMKEFNDDRNLLDKLYHKFKYTGKVFSFAQHNELNASELKYIISKCAIMVTSRFHVAIASYSQSIPTLVVGYSVRTLGIAKDLFGDTEKYILPVQQLVQTDDLVKKFKVLKEEAKTIKTKLDNILPKYKEQIGIAFKEVSNL